MVHAGGSQQVLQFPSNFRLPRDAPGLSVHDMKTSRARMQPTDASHGIEYPGPLGHRTRNEPELHVDSATPNKPKS
jgi:hypothetical protein